MNSAHAIEVDKRLQPRAHNLRDLIGLAAVQDARELVGISFGHHW
jgi:hypothetical protein